MRSKKIVLSNFSRSLYSESFCLRPDNEKQLIECIADNKQERLLARGAGLSYNDSCLNNNGLVIDTTRLNHLISFNQDSGIAVCQAHAPFKDLFLLDPQFIPPVIPGTVHATVAGGIAHDVHGKNNPHEGSFGRHILWFELLINDKKIRCSREEHSDLFYATIAGLGLTGVITQVAIRLKKASRYVQVENRSFNSFKTLMGQMSADNPTYDYQVAWVDLLNEEQNSILSLANHCTAVSRPPKKTTSTHKVPKIPFGLIKSWNMKLFNKIYATSKKPKELLSLEEFNNPLDKIAHWNRLYGPKGLIQFQAVFDQDNACNTLEQLIHLIQCNKATPTLAVLKLFSQAGEGILSFCKPGFTIAIDFIHNTAAKQAIKAMNQLISEMNGRIYLAKDLLLTPEQYKKTYTNHEYFSQILAHHQCAMRSDLAKRLGII
ncbi:FAD-binding oxidoreductase [Legionella fallonii]|uniref:Putative oxidoreductase n=1 Tax=Legionella fallonii LLAP-10 TaxID=1212491 RepID=A0A098G1W3_9GAMM|nr:FAD-binding oxidoreductase [Legionella fallonii]CEG56467.1 putative oxidoreductase [Legionella fallonii LLAP-10]